MSLFCWLQLKCAAFLPVPPLSFFLPSWEQELHRSCTAWPFFSEERPCHAVSKRFHGEKHPVFGEVRRVGQRSRAEETMVEDSLCHLRTRWKFSGCRLWPDPLMVDSEELFPAELPRFSDITGLTCQLGKFHSASRFFAKKVWFLPGDLPKQAGEELLPKIADEKKGLEWDLAFWRIAVVWKSLKYTMWGPPSDVSWLTKAPVTIVINKSHKP